MRLFHVYGEEPDGRISTAVVEANWMIDAMLRYEAKAPFNGYKGMRSMLMMWADEVER